MTSSGQSSQPRELERCNAIELLEHDPRPTFVLDLQDVDHNKLTSTLPLFLNQALRLNPKLHAAIVGAPTGTTSETGTDHSNDFEAFWKWARASGDHNTAREQSLTYHFSDVTWISFIFKGSWKFISAALQSPDISSGPFTSTDVAIPTNTPTVKPRHAGEAHDTLTNAYSQPMQDRNPDWENGEPPDLDTGLQWTATSPNGSVNLDPILALSTPEKGIPDCTAENPSGVLSPHLMFFRGLNWASTPLGPMSSWSREFKQIVNLTMGNPHPAALFWGNELTMLYNEAYAVEVAGAKHPALLGTGFAGPFKEIWEGVRPLFVECARTGTSIRKDNDVLFMDRNGYIEETYFSWSWTPLYGSGSTILGFYNAPFETTGYCIGRRRTRTLQRLNQSSSTAKTVTDFWQCAIGALEDNSYDIPFALLYSVEDASSADATEESSWTSVNTKSFTSCILEGSIGIPAGHVAAPQRLNLEAASKGWTPSIREAMRTREPTLLNLSDGTLSEELIQGLDTRGFCEPCQEAVLLPIRPTNSDAILSFLLLGCNPRLRYNDEYKSFITLMNWQLSTSLASTLLYEEETRRSKIEQEQLNRQLAVQTDRLKRMTALSPLGMFYIDAGGTILEANDRYFEMTGQCRDDMYEMSWMNQLVGSSKKTMEEGWSKLTRDLQPFSAELQLDKQCIDSNTPTIESIDYWVLTNAYPELTSEGKLRSIMGSITDISHLKWAQGLQEQRLREAEETRRQQNEFIDITSHEMRNPMSAVLQCAEDISNSLSAYRNRGQDSLDVVLDDCIDLAGTITLCIQHQKTIVDDILTVSKLDSNLVVLTPNPVQPVGVVRKIVKLFEPEFLSKKIHFDFVLHDSFNSLAIEWLLMDASRFSQIVINFMTNAIKFMNGRADRNITMYMGASVEPPIPQTPDFLYIPRKPAKHNAFVDDGWRQGDTVYLRLKVQDTGCGLTNKEKQLLFQRFQQASPRTHAQYGGSGLGLFISRQLTELHGGQIGVASVADIGSTFGFFIRTKRTSQPDNPVSLFASPTVQPWPSQNGAQRVPVTHPDALQVKTPTSVSPAIANPVSSAGVKMGYSLLVVEDNLVNQRILTKQLRKAGCTVTAADNGQIALDILQTTQFRKDGGIPLTAVLMDLEMPVMDGLTCVKEIRRLEAEGTIRSHVPVIAITANVRLEQIRNAKASGMDDVVSKPFRIPDILTQIKAVLKSLDGEVAH